MGEIFRREAAENPGPFTGERLTAAVDGQVQIEHYHRYLFARSMARGLDVLDVASGEGYGSALLSQVARSVTGIEYSTPAVAGAAENFPRPNLHFLQGDARALPLADACMDAVVSFETIEHFDAHEAFLREVVRVLRSDGYLIISTPDRDVYSPIGSPANPYHVHELTRTEFVALLRSHFQHVHVLQQRSLLGSALLGESGSAAAPQVFDRRGATHVEACAGLPRAPYLVAVASDRALPALPPSIYIEHSDLDGDKVRLAELNCRFDNVQAELARALSALSFSQTELAQVQQALAETQATAQVDAGRAHDEFERVSSELRIVTEAARVTELARAEVAEQNDALHYRLAAVQGSLRTFLRGYLPLLRRHLSGHRG